MPEVFSISKDGLDALRNAGPVEPEEELILEVMSRVVSISQENAMSLCNQLCEKFGSVEGALTALRSGDVLITKVD